MNFLLKTLLLCLTCLYFVGCTGLQDNKKNIDSIIITSNNYESRPLAELIQSRNDQLIIQLPGNKADTKLYVNGPNNQLMTIDDDKFASFLNFVNPKRIIILGNTNYVPQSYINQINPLTKKYIFDDNNWQVIAWQVEELTGLDGIAKRYITVLDELVRSNTIDGYNSPSAPSEPQILYPSVK